MTVGLLNLGYNVRLQKVIATKTRLPGQLVGSSTQFMSRSYHRAADTIASLQIVWANWYVNSSGFAETGSGATASVDAAVEYNGTFTPILFGGSLTGTVASLANIVSDVCNVSVPKGAFFFIRMWVRCSTGTVSSLAVFPGEILDTVDGEAVTYGATVSNQTLGGTVTNTSGNKQLWAGPVAIIGSTNIPSVYLAGDSRVFGYADSFTNSSGDTGELARSIGPSCGYINAGISGLSLTNYITNNARQLALASYCTNIIYECGEFDIKNIGQSAATVYANLQTLWGQTPAGVKPFQALLVGESSSTDGWATVGNQTTDASNSVRNTVNASIVSSPPTGGYFNIPLALEPVAGNGLWNAPNYTSDGIHELSTAAVAIQNSGVIDTSRFT